jgi:SAM-dependent methyltransferase
MAVSERFPTAPAWYRPLLSVEDAVLYRLRNHLPTQAHLHGEDASTANFMSNVRLGIPAAERMVPGANASPYMMQHVSRYLWAMDICRGRDVVDLGCGDGYGTAMLSWVARSAVGIDLNSDAVTAASRKYPGVNYCVGDLTVADTIPATEVAVCFEVLEHIAEPGRVLEAIAPRVQRLLVSKPNPLAGGSHINPHHVNDWPLTTLKHRLRQTGAREIKCHHQTLRGYRMRRRALPWDAFWLLDVRY